jgi:hypothetical protein
MDPIDSLKDLALLWACSCDPIPGGLLQWTPDKFAATVICDSIVDSITACEPFRAQVLADAKFFLRGPLPGIGAHVEIRGGLPFMSYQHWERAISPFLFTVHWSWTMRASTDDWDKFDYELDRVVFEDGRWRVASIYNDERREKNMSDLRTIWAKLERRSSHM